MVSQKNQMFENVKRQNVYIYIETNELYMVHRMKNLKHDNFPRGQNSNLGTDDSPLGTYFFAPLKI